jgi:hypothetical protein
MEMMKRGEFLQKSIEGNKAEKESIGVVVNKQTSFKKDKEGDRLHHGRHDRRVRSWACQRDPVYLMMSLI